jgi:glycosyltransferase involved in cell wall biosynthesis
MSDNQIKNVIIINPMASRKPTGMGVAGISLQKFFPTFVRERVNSVFQFINDSLPIGLLKMIFRAGAAQMAAFIFFNKTKIFTTHQGPLIHCGRTIVVIHDFICLAHPFQKRAQTLYYLFIVPRVIKQADKVVVISNPVKKQLLAFFPTLPRDRVHVIPTLSWRLESYQPGRLTLNERIANRTFLFVGANYLHKRLDVAIRAMELLSQKISGARLIVTGSQKAIWEKAFGYDFDQMKQKGIELRAYASEEELETLYENASALLFLSDMEGLGLPPLEAMKKSCPVICHNSEELQDTCADAAFYLSNKEPEKLAQFLENFLNHQMDAEIENKRSAGLARVEKFRAEAIKTAWNEVLNCP